MELRAAGANEPAAAGAPVAASCSPAILAPRCDDPGAVQEPGRRRPGRRRRLRRRHELATPPTIRWPACCPAAIRAVSGSVGSEARTTTGWLCSTPPVPTRTGRTRSIRKQACSHTSATTSSPARSCTRRAAAATSCCASLSTPSTRTRPHATKFRPFSCSARQPRARGATWSFSASPYLAGRTSHRSTTSSLSGVPRQASAFRTTRRHSPCSMSP